MSRNFDTETQGGQVSRLWSCSTLQDGVNHLGPGDGSQDEEALLLKQIQDTCGRRFVYIVRKKNIVYIHLEVPNTCTSWSCRMLHFQKAFFRIRHVFLDINIDRNIYWINF